MKNTSNLFWQIPLEHLFHNLGSSREGLSSQEAEQRLYQYGPNQIKPSKVGAFYILLQNFRNPLVILLLISAGLTALIGSGKSAIIIVLIVLGSILIDFIQEYHANGTIAALQSLITLKAWVIRNGKKIEVPMSSIMPGDIVELSAGDLIPGDGIIINAKDFFVNQSALTGESTPIEKTAVSTPVPIISPLYCPNVVLLGTSVVSGWAQALVCQIGIKTILGSVASSVQETRPVSVFIRGTKQLGILLMQITGVLVIVTLSFNIILQRPWLDTILFAIAIGVGLTPQFLNVIISITFARFAVLLSKQKVIVKKLSAIYDLGTMDVLCTDKTGTLTEACIKVEEASDWEGNPNQRVFLLGYLNSSFETGYKSPLDNAILSYQSLDISAWKKLDELPFDAGHRRISVLASDGKERLLIIKGPLEDVVNKCQYLEDANQNSIKPLDSISKQKIQTLFKNLSEHGLRVLGVAYKHIPDDYQQIRPADEQNLTFVGYISFSDQLKDSAQEAIHFLSKHGTNLKIVTGDNEYVTKHICEKLSIPIQGVLLGPEIENSTDETLKRRVEDVNIYCRVTPHQKKRIVQALQTNGHMVGFLGDGINDLAAFSAANVSISVDNAVPAAKEVAHFVLLDRNLEILHQSILEARRAFNNILKYMMTGISSNFGNMISMAGASLLLPFLPMLPVQILLNNFLYDFSEIGIPYDKVDSELYLKPPKWDIKFLRNFMFVFGPLSSIFDFFVFYLLLIVLQAPSPLFQTGWFIESLLTQVFMIFIIRTKRAFNKSPPHLFLIFTALLSVIIGISLPYTPYAQYFGFVPLPLSFFGILAMITIVYVIISEVSKRLFYRPILAY